LHKICWNLELPDKEKKSNEAHPSIHPTKYTNSLQGSFTVRSCLSLKIDRVNQGDKTFTLHIYIIFTVISYSYIFLLLCEYIHIHNSHQIGQEIHNK